MNDTHKIVYHLEANDRQLRSTIQKLGTYMKANSPKMSIALDPNSARNLNNVATGLKQTGKAAKDTEHKMKSLGQATALAAARFAAFSIAATPLALLRVLF